VLPTQWNGSWFKKQRTAFFKKAMKWDSVAVAEHNHSLGATRYSPSPLPHSRLHHMPLLTHSRPHYVPLLPHCRPGLTICLCCLTLALTTAVSLLLPHFVFSLPLSHCLLPTVTAKKPRSTTEKAKDARNLNCKGSDVMSNPKVLTAVYLLTAVHLLTVVHFRTAAYLLIAAVHKIFYILPYSCAHYKVM
jgi:hypothetical protein